MSKKEKKNQIMNMWRGTIRNHEEISLLKIQDKVCPISVAQYRTILYFIVAAVTPGDSSSCRQEAACRHGGVYFKKLARV